MMLSEYENEHPQRACAPKYEIGEPGYCEGDCPSCDGKGVRWFRPPTLSPSDCEWRECTPCEGTGRIRLKVDIPGYCGPGTNLEEGESLPPATKPIPLVDRQHQAARRRLSIATKAKWLAAAQCLSEGAAETVEIIRNADAGGVPAEQAIRTSAEGLLLLIEGSDDDIPGLPKAAGLLLAAYVRPETEAQPASEGTKIKANDYRNTFRTQV